MPLVLLAMTVALLHVPQEADSAPASRPFSDARAGYVVHIPEGYFGLATDPVQEATRKGLHCWIDGQDEGSATICIEQSRQLPADAQDMTFTWKGHDIGGGHARVSVAGGSQDVYIAMVPLKAGMVRLTSVAAVPHGMRAQSALVRMLTSLEGEPGWEGDTERAERMGSAVGQIGVIVLAIAAGMWIAKRRKGASSA